MLSGFYAFKVQEEGSDVRHFLDHPDTIYQNPAPPKTLSRICLDTIIKHPPLVEECSPDLPQELREQMIVRCFEERKRDLLDPLFRTWSKHPSISFRQLFPHFLYTFRTDTQRKLNDFKEFFKNTVLHLIKDKVLNIDQETVNAVKLIDLTGIVGPQHDIKELLSVPFTATECVTLKVDMAMYTRHGDKQDVEERWIQASQGNQHIQIKINLVSTNMRTVQQHNQLLSSLLEEDLMGVDLDGEEEDFRLSQVTSTVSRCEKTIRYLGLSLSTDPHDNEPETTLNNLFKRCQNLTTLQLCWYHTVPVQSLSRCLQDLRLENLKLEFNNWNLQIEDHQTLFGNCLGLKQLTIEYINLSEVDVEKLTEENGENLHLEVLEIQSYHYESSGDQQFNVVDFIKFFKALKCFNLLWPLADCLDFDNSICALHIQTFNIDFENEQLNQNQVMEVMKVNNYNYYTKEAEEEDGAWITIGARKAAEN